MQIELSSNLKIVFQKTINFWRETLANKVSRSKLRYSETFTFSFTAAGLSVELQAELKTLYLKGRALAKENSHAFTIRWNKKVFHIWQYHVFLMCIWSKRVFNCFQIRQYYAV